MRAPWRSYKRDAFNFEQAIFRQARYLNGRARRWIFFEIRGVDTIHRAKVIHVLEEHGGFDNLAVIAARSAQNRADVLERLMGLRFDTTND